MAPLAVSHSNASAILGVAPCGLPSRSRPSRAAARRRRRRGQAVWEKMQYDVLFLDCQMPEMDGYETVARIRERENGKRHIPVVAMVAHIMAGDREVCLRAGMDDYLAKPFKPEDLLTQLKRIPQGYGRGAH